MKKLLVILSSLGVLSLALPVPALAARADGPKAKLMAKYDTNKNGKLDPDEIAAIRKDFAADPNGDLKRFDTDKDGKLSDEEIAKMVPGSGGKKSSDKAPKTDAEKQSDAGKAKTP